MDAYLQIAADVLAAERRPLSPRAILEFAYKRAIVPAHLHGRTQHKTLQARISEDIVSRREHSIFFRTQPGKFFLRRFLADQNLPEEFRTVFPARRRIRELINGPVLAMERSLLSEVAAKNVPIQPDRVLSILRADRFCYEDPRQRNEDLVFLRSFVCVYRGYDLLSYRVGRYRDDRDTFLAKRSIGFSTFVSIDDQTLFNLGTLGIVEAGVRATKIDLDIPDMSATESLGARLKYFVWSTKSAEANSDLLAVVDFECPAWFEPLKRRLALNDLCWLDSSKPVNDLDDFDPWSSLVLLAHYRSYLERAGHSESNYPSSRSSSDGLS
jgi:hypothetical protein